MGLRINTNTAAKNAERNLRAQTQAERVSVERLSSGSRINHAGDDAAGLAISEKMRADFRSNRQAVRNTNDGISMVQVAEGAMNEIANMLVRLRELSIQGASDTISDNERALIDKEGQQLVGEVGRIASTTTFNGVPLLNSGPRYLTIQAGIGSDPDNDRLYYDLWVENSNVERLGIDGLNLLTRDGCQDNLAKIDHAIYRVNKNRAGLGALQNQMASSVNNGDVYGENLADAKSRIKDADYAQETADMTKNNILANASLAVLSQANQSGKLALKLLDG